MANVTVTPDAFEYVAFDRDEIVVVANRLCVQLGLPADQDLLIEIDEGTPGARAWLVSVEPMVLHVEGGAFEHTRKVRTFSDVRCADALGRLLYRTLDRLNPDFGEPPEDSELTLAQWTTWEIYCVGRLVRLGYEGQRARRLYQFRNRHGFSDLTDTYFERLWSAEGLTWAELTQMSKEATMEKAS